MGYSRRREPSQRTVQGLWLLAILLLLAIVFLVKGLFFSPSKGAFSQPIHHQTSSWAVSSPSSSEPIWQKQASPVTIPILMYHAIHDMAPEEAANRSLIVSPATFESHLAALKAAGYYFLTPQEAHQALTGNALPADKVVWLTFDDSLWDFYEVAFPILSRHGARATNSVITGFTEEGREGHLTPEQILDMAEQGMSFESHTVTHPDLSVLSSDQQSWELTTSQTYLNHLLNQETKTIIYPAGRYNEDTLTVAQEAGYQLGLTTNEGLARLDNGLLTLNRIRVLPDMTAEALLLTMENQP